MTKKKKETEKHIIAAIGASADGIKAMEAFFSNLPKKTGIAFVVIQHLSPDYKSILPNILQNKTSLKVLEIEDKAYPEPDHVYVLPAGYDVTLSGDKFHLEKYSKTQKGLHLPIDLFFRSLAADRKGKTAAILLSGSGSDGSQGIREIKNGGGLVMVQDPESAKFRSMPQNAIETGTVDKIARPEDLPDLLLEFQKNFDKEEKPFDDENSADLLSKIFNLLEVKTGHDFSGYKKNTIYRRIRRRMTMHKKTKLKDYVNFLEENSEEVHSLFKELLICVTSFFRNKEAFETLKEEVFPEIIGKSNKNTVRIWVAACATGEEVYSLAILAKEFQESKQIRTDMQFFATDVDETALNIAREGKYKENIKADVSGHLLEKYFQKTDDLYQIHKDIRDMVTFAEHDAIKDPPYSKLDMISCRNFLIYLEPDIQKNLLNTFHYALLPERYLFLGHSETHSVKDDLFGIVDANARIYRKKENRKAIVDYISKKRKKEHHVDSSEDRGKTGTKKMSVKEFAESKALKEYLQPFLLIDKKGEIHYSLGRCDKYFRFHVGEPNQNIVNLAREGLKISISSALRKLNSENKPVSFKNVRVGGNENREESNFIDLTLLPIENPSYFNHLVIVTIKPSSREYQLSGSQEDIEKISRDSEDYIEQMEQELQETREYLNNVIEELETSNEELKSANEEAQSTNEELQSTNEELETSKEEMQSLNEELETSNNELQRRIEEVTHINNDLNNFLKSTDIGILFLDKNLKIRRFSPRINEIVNLRESDLGRNIQDFGIKFLQEQLVEDVMQVLDKLSPVEKEVSRGESKKFWMRILPYRTVRDQIDGVVITFTDITEKHRVQKLIEESERWKKYRHLFHHMEHGFALYKVIKDKKENIDDFKLIEANPAYENMMQVELEKTRNKKVSELLADKKLGDKFVEASKKALAGEAYHEERYFEKSGKYFNILYFSHEENVVATFVQDITRDKEEMKADLHLASIVESTEDAIFSESPNGDILSWNEGAINLYGYREEEALDTNANELYAYPKDDGDMAMIRQVKNGDKVKNRETFHRRKDGSVVPVSVTKSPIKDDNGKVVAISNIVKDITLVKNREKELVHAKEAAEKAVVLKTMFLSNMSHEIRTPLNSILGFTDLLRDEVKKDKPLKYLDNISNSGNQLLYLINDIVDVSRLDAGELPVNPTNLNIGRLMKKTKDQFEGYAAENKKTNIGFSLKLPEGAEDLHLIADEHRLQQILHNLLSNAFKYTRKGRIEFGFEIQKKDTLLFYVKDTGKGISKEYQNKIFYRFQQVEDDSDNSETVIRGTGLGLAIAIGLAELLGGKMWVDSQKGEGSVFYFTLPFKKSKTPEAKESQTTEKTSDIPRLKGKKVIIGEDDPYSLQMLKFMLKATGISMFIASDGDKVIELFENNQVDILLLDIRMPKKDGYELIREIRSKNPDIPVIAQTAFAMPEQVEKSRKMGFNEHLIKPIARESLYSALEKYLK